MCVFYLNVQNFTKNMLTLDYGLFIILKCFGGAAMIGGIAPDCKSGTLKRSWFESNRPHQI